MTKHECRNHFETVELWHQALKLFDKNTQLYLQDKNNYQSFLCNTELIQEASSLVLNYFWLVSKIMRKHQDTLPDTRITSLNLPHEIERLQCLFIESCASRYYAIRKVQKSFGCFSAGIDNVAFSKIEYEFLRYRENYWPKVKEEFHCFIVHKECNRIKGKKQLRLANKNRKLIKTVFLKPLYDNYLKFSRVLTARTRSTHKLGFSQKNVILNKYETDCVLKK